MADATSRKFVDRDENKSEKPRKIARVEVKSDQSEADCITSLKDFKFCKILYNDINSRTIYIQGKYKKDEQPEKDALIKLEKSPFDDRTIEKYLTKDTELRLTFQNDIYYQYTATAIPELNSLKAITIVPATDKHMLKYSKQDFYIVNETPRDYKEITLPYINGNQHSLQWVYNILAHKAETNRIIYEDPAPDKGFMLLPDLKWNEQQVGDLHLTAIVNERGIHSLRDLKKEHLPLLKNVLMKGKEAAADKYKVDPNQLRIFVHYYPSYYHLHVHFMSTANVYVSCAIGKAHFVDDIIDNIENIDVDFYQKKTLAVAIGSQNPLLQRFVDEGRLTKPMSE